MKPSLLKFSVFLVLLFVSNLLNAQNDIINTLKGEQIICNITKEDSIKVYFKIGGNITGIEASILRKEIKSIEYAQIKQEAPQLIADPGSETISVEKVDYVNSENIIVNPTKDSFTKNGVFLAIGNALPLGKFAKQKLDTNEIGPGNSGYVVGIGFVHYTKNNLGFDMRACYANNELNAAPIASKYQYHTDSVWSPEKSNWQSYSLNIGILYQKKFKYFGAFARLSAGFTTLKYPDLKLSISSKNYIQFQSVNADAISFGIGGGLSYEVLENLEVILNVDYNHAKFKYSEVLFIGETPSGLSTKRISGTKRDVIQVYQNLFTTLGVCFWF